MPTLPAHNPIMAILAAAALTWGIVILIYLANGCKASQAIAESARWAAVLGVALALAYLGVIVGHWPAWPSFLISGAALITAGASSGYLPAPRRRIR